MFESDKELLRKYEDDLNVSGTGVIIMGAWGIVRVLMEIFLGAKDQLKLEEEDPVIIMAGMAVVFAIVVLIAVIVMKVHLYIGLNAMRAAKGRKYKKGYFAATVIILILSVAGMTSYREKLQDLNNIDTTVAAILVDLTTIYILGVIIRSSLKIKELKGKELRE